VTEITTGLFFIIAYYIRVVFDIIWHALAFDLGKLQ